MVLLKCFRRMFELSRQSLAMENNLQNPCRIRLKRSLSLILIGLASVQPLFAQEKEKSVLPEHYVLGPIRVFYAIDGKSAVPSADKDASGIPDHVEDVAKQVWAAHRLFCSVLEFPDPLTSERYPGVNCIQVSLRERGEIGGGNGKAFENSQRARPIPEGKPDDRAIVISMGSHVEGLKNITPAHEMFHLIQYGATYFKKSWYLEGQARWSEHALAKEGLGDVKYSPKGPWPQEPANLTKLFGMSYDAEFVLWNPIAKKTDAKGTLPQKRLDKELTELCYSDGSPVLKDLDLTGANIMREILIELGKMDDVAYKELGYESWSEENQQSPKNDRYMYQAIMDVLRRQSPPVGRFKADAKAK